MNKLELLKIRSILERKMKNEQYLDEKSIYDIIEIIIKQRKFKSMIDNINLLNEKSNGNIGSYSPVDKNLNIVLPSELNDYYDYNTTIMHVLLHEFEHVDQHKKCLDKKNKNFEVDLLDTCFKSNNYLENLMKRLNNNNIPKEEYISIIEQLKFYQMYSEIVNKDCYELLPSERQAEINSFKYLIELMKRINDEKYKEKNEIIKVNYLLRNLMGYKINGKDIIAPTYELYRIILDFMNQSELTGRFYDNFKRIEEDMDLEQRLYYGFNISLEEYNNKRLEIGQHLIK
ncbi:MAG: hypothetical protein J6K21_01820 [Bacilli bacterium]|nr:hypothetical protein [Bacilli bacterium]